MSYRNQTYVVFDGDSDMWAYAYMRGWKALPMVPFNFHDAHDLGSELTNLAKEASIKRVLRNRFSSTKQVVVLIGPNTRYLYRFVRWELEVAVELGLPIIGVNLNGKRDFDPDRCPPIIRDEFVIHVSFKRAIMKYALDDFPDRHAARDRNLRRPLRYADEVYGRLGLNAAPALVRASIAGRISMALLGGSSPPSSPPWPSYPTK